jgi:hypothetical protein
MELTAEERVDEILGDAESFARFIVVEARRQKKSIESVVMSTAYLASIFREKEPEIWEDAENIFAAVKVAIDEAKESHL